MNPYFCLFLILCLGTLFFSIYRYLKSGIAQRYKILLISLRILLILFLLAAFTEPEFHFDRVNKNSTIPVMVDVSQSMSLFQPETSVIPFLKELAAANNSSRNRSFVFFEFGDSLRRMKKKSSQLFTDQNSNFPLLSRNRIFSRSSELILISDANWTNNEINLDQFSDKIIHYLPLSKKISLPYLTTSIPQNSFSSPADSSLTIPLTVNGYFTKEDTVRITVFENEKTVFSRSLSVPSGIFSKIIEIGLTPTTPGKKIYRIESSYGNGTVHTARHAIRYALPEIFSYSLQPTQQSLDLRFIKLNLSRHPEFKEIQFGNSKPDLLFFFALDSIAAKNYTVNDNGILVFAGTLPTPKQIIQINENAFSFHHPSTSSPFNKSDIASFPPPSTILTSKKIIPAVTMLSAHIFGKEQSTVPIVYTSEYLQKAVIIIAATDFWRWDFWPLSVTHSEENAFAFSEIFIKLLKEELYRRHSETFYAYTVSTLKEQDSIALQLSFPSSVPVQANGTINVTIKDSNNRICHETTVSLIKSGSLYQKILLKPLTQGKYIYTCELSSDGKKYKHSDIFYIEKNQTELIVNDQNTSILNQIGQPIDPKNTGLFTEKLLKAQNNPDELTRVNFRFSRDWILLSVILVLFSTEWFLRRYINLD